MIETPVMIDIHTENKAAIANLRQAMVDFDEPGVRAVLREHLEA